ncbi:hypothetical protein [Alkalibacterium sp. 20]|uniref:hypothetical protein n=1 Tax=Alkalibacterium sp. 20 TaxID=1798803 RepID=UPI0009002E6C|nr:hypothetical protein [Alkalibacterium sp. 20]OJF96178.1 hypothetical protein AX762_05445 [Alkalibacterium sp. 20]
MGVKNNEIPEIGKKINRFVDTLKRNPSKIYFSLFFLYFLGLCTFLFINLTSEASINVEGNAINQPINLNNNAITLVSRTVNNETNLVKLVFFYTNKSRSELQDINLNFETIPYSNTDYLLESEVIKATDNYYVVFIKNIPADFKALSTTISEDRTYLNTTISSEDSGNESVDMSNAGMNIRVRGLEESFDVDNDLIIEDKLYYARESVEYEIEINEEIIKKHEDEIISLTDNDIDIDTEIEKINSETPYELDENIPGLEREIISFEEKKIENRTETKKINDKIEKINKQNRLLQTKKEDMQ